MGERRAARLVARAVAQHGVDGDQQLAGDGDENGLGGLSGDLHALAQALLPAVRGPAEAAGELLLAALEPYKAEYARAMLAAGQKRCVPQPWAP